MIQNESHLILFKYFKSCLQRINIYCLSILGAMIRLEQTYSLCLCCIVLVRKIVEKSAQMASLFRYITNSYCAMVADIPVKLDEKFPIRTPSSRIGAVKPLLPVNSRFMGGLNNLGNTCYMNAAIQCLLSVPPFVEYFISSRYEHHINERNKLGTGGRLAKSFAKLIGEMASTNWSYKIHVGEFKKIVSKHQSRFEGHDQNDAEEFLSYLLDALHEDLNRIIEKPYKEIDDNSKKSDETRAEEIWTIHKSRNDSIIVDLFHFLLKSTVKCSRCGKKSITFDPTAILSVPINVKEIMWITVAFVPFSTDEKITKKSPQEFSANIQYTDFLESIQATILYCKVRTTYRDCIYDLMKHLVDLLHIEPDDARMVLCTLERNHVKSLYYDANLSVSSLYDDLTDQETVYAYQLAPDSGEDDQNCMAIIYNYDGINGDMFGIPWLVRLHSYQIENYDCLKAAVMFVSSRIFEWPREEGAVKPFTVKFCTMWFDSPLMKHDFFELDPNINEIFRIICTDRTGRYSRFVVDRNRTPDYHRLVYLRIEWQPYFMRFIDRRHHFQYHESYRRYVEPRKKILLSDCLNLFATEEDLDENHWYCPKCKKHRPAKKQLSLWTLPKILLVHFKRFSHERMHKIKEPVIYPIRDFQLKNWLVNRKVPEIMYDLVGVCNHEGDLAGGHYLTHSKRHTGWFEFDDKFVKRISEDDIVSTNAYLLIYLARDEKLFIDYY